MGQIAIPTSGGGKKELTTTGFPSSLSAQTISINCEIGDIIAYYAVMAAYYPVSLTGATKIGSENVNNADSSEYTGARIISGLAKAAATTVSFSAYRGRITKITLA